jgi:2-amino-4-hydroxy-6-hydroxymethyldihydropteridine diphosphokinase
MINCWVKKINSHANLKKEIEYYFCTMLATTYILLGSNLGNRMKMLLSAEDLIQSTAGVISAVSKVYETAAWGNTNQDAFLNKVIELKTSHSPEALLSLLLAAEIELGRVRNEKWGPRTIDLDILYYNSDIIQSDKLTLPHPEIGNRRFTLVPLCDIASNYINPIFHKSNADLLVQCSDQSEVKLFSQP